MTLPPCSPSVTLTAAGRSRTAVYVPPWIESRESSFPRRVAVPVGQTGLSRVAGTVLSALRLDSLAATVPAQIWSKQVGDARCKLKRIYPKIIH